MSAISLSSLLQYTLQTWDGGVTLALNGEADYVAVPAMRRLLNDLQDKKLPLLIVDLTDVTFLNTPFWAALQVYQLKGQPRSRLAVCGMNESLTAAFNLNGVGDASEEGNRVHVYGTCDEAKRASGHDSRVA